MAAASPVFKKTYADYLAQIAALGRDRLGPMLGAGVDGRKITIPFLGRQFSVTDTAFVDAAGERVDFEGCVVLARYLLMCPDELPRETDWTHFRDFKETGPLTVYFDRDVEQALAGLFAEDITAAAAAVNALGGVTPDIGAAYDYVAQVRALPNVPVLILFNDADPDAPADFPATCSLLFEKRADRFLDPESLAVLGRVVFVWLQNYVRQERAV